MSESYAFIAAENADPDCPWPLIKMCAWLNVSRSEFYEYIDREPSNIKRRRERLLVLIKAILFEESRGTYGYRRVHAAVLRAGEQASPELVRALMVSAGLVAYQPRPFRTTTVADPAATDPRITSGVTSPPRRRVSNSSATSLISRPGRAGCI